ncbi:MAG: restriction endonuclease [Chloroflexi bacterium]|nr:restriction endonuclease [Chloroflexota bacterium]
MKVPKLPFPLLKRIETSLITIFQSLYTHKDLKHFLEKHVPKEILSRYYEPEQSTPSKMRYRGVTLIEGIDYYKKGASKKTIIESVARELNDRGLIGVLLGMVDELLANQDVAAGTNLADALQDLRDIRQQIQLNERVPVESKGVRVEQVEPSKRRQDEIEKLRKEYLELLGEPDRQKRGYLFQDFLSRLWAVHGLKLTQPFRIKGEEIDGAFNFESRYFLVAARWREEPTNASAVYELKGKVEGKLVGTLGLFVSVNDFTDDTAEATTKGKEINTILMDGEDIWFVLEKWVDLPTLLRGKLRYASERGQAFLRAKELLG